MAQWPVVRVRPACPADALAVAGVHVRAWQVAYRGLLPDDHLDTLRVDEARLARYRLGDDDPAAPFTALAADPDGTVTGFVTVGPSRDGDVPGAGECYALYVDPPRWGEGIARRLLAEGRRVLVARGHRLGALWVLAGNEPAQRVYRADGWALDGAARHEEVWGVPADVVRMRRPLP